MRARDVVVVVVADHDDQADHQPITRATRIPIVQRARVFTGPILAEGPAENLERLVDLGLADRPAGGRKRRVSSPIGLTIRPSASRRPAAASLRVDSLEAGAEHQAAAADLRDRVDPLETLA